MQYIGLVDCNNFFVSCERLFRPDLEGRPVAVLSSNDGCVVARSNEVKALGVPMGVPYFQMKDVFKKADVTLFSSNFTLYRDISRRVMAVLREYYPDMEQYSVDESFFILTATDKAEAEQKGYALKADIERLVGVPVSIGLASTKTIAKYASKVGKVGGGVAVLRGADWLALQSEVPVHAIWGIGPKLEQSLAKHDIRTVAELCAADRARVTKLFGIGGARLQDELSERRVFNIGDVSSPQQSIMSTRSFHTTTHDALVIEDALLHHVHQIAAELRQKECVAQHIRVIARPSRHSDWLLATGSAEQTLDTPLCDTKELSAVAVALFRNFYDPDVPYKKAGVVVGMLRPASAVQPGLFAAPEEKAEKNVLWQTIDILNDRFGIEMVHLGVRQKEAAWHTNQQYISPAYTTKWIDIAVIKG